MTGSVARMLPRRKARVEIIPLIDVIFFLLATFVLFTLSLNRILSLGVELPDTVPPDTAVPPPVIIKVTETGALLWNQDPIHRDELPARLAQLNETASDPRILVAGEPAAEFGGAIEVLDQVRLAGIAKVTVDLNTPKSAR